MGEIFNKHGYNSLNKFGELVQAGVEVQALLAQYRRDQVSSADEPNFLPLDNPTTPYYLQLRRLRLMYHAYDGLESVGIHLLKGEEEFRKLESMSDEELLLIKGIGVVKLRQIRTMLADYKTPTIDDIRNG